LAARRIRWRVAALGPGASRMTIETSVVDTPTCAATSANVGRRLGIAPGVSATRSLYRSPFNVEGSAP
jgi:hypothetical protein